MKLRISAVCNIGCVRQNNEDMVLIDKKLIRDDTIQGAIEFSEGCNLYIVAVADGMGGQNAGEYASQMVLEQLNEKIHALPSNLGEDILTSQISVICNDTHKLILSASKQDTSKTGMGTTLVALLLYNDKFFVINVGDSRLYRFRNGNLMQLSQDHSLRNLSNNPDTPSNIIVNSFGGGNSFFIDFMPAGKKYLARDLFLLCSDGLSDMICDDEIEEILSQENPELNLLEQAKNNGGNDNISYVIVDILS